MKLIQQYGDMRTGTTYITWLLYRNFMDILISRIRKHDGPSSNNGENYINNIKKIEETIREDNLEVTPNHFINNDDIFYIITFKDPYAFCLGHKKGHDKWPINTTVGWWNISTNRFLNFYDNNRENTVWIRYEDLLTNEGRNLVLDEIKNKFSLTKKNESYIDVVRHAHGVYSGNKDKYDKEYHINREYMTELTTDEKIYIKNNINTTLSKRVGYN